MNLFGLAAYGALCSAVYYFLPRRFRWMLLLMASLGFYAVRAASGLPYLLLTAASVYVAALRMGRIDAGLAAKLRAQALSPAEKKQLRAKAKRRKRAWMLAALVLNLSILAALKYTDDLRGWFSLSPLGLLLPLGISFYTFQSTGYLLDVYNGKATPERHFAKFLLFVSFFPQLLQGPIGRFDALAGQLAEPHDFDAKAWQRGALRMLWGLIQKLVIADRAAPLVEAIFSCAPGEMGGMAALVGVLAYALQQYCDFSGGIDLVTGIAELFGVHLAPNFRRPYFAVSLADFWRRWHISLGAWMRDYVFYPFALSVPMRRLTRAAKPRLGAAVARALPAALGNLLVFLLVGLWHGATPNYLFWGLYNGLILAISALLEPRYRAWGERHSALSASRGFHLLRVLRTFMIVNIGWFFDRSARISDAFLRLGSLFADLRPAQVDAAFLAGHGLPASDGALLGLFTALLLCVSLMAERGVDLRAAVLRLPWPARTALFYALLLCVLVFGVWGSGFSSASFIYYQF